MLQRMNFALVVTVLVSASVLGGSALAQKQPVSKPVNKQILAEDEVKQLLLLMDTDKNGKISKQEWMKFMEAEFDRLDKNKNGELDVKEIAQSALRVSRSANVGK